jgi:leucyl-tRNA synthetase
MALSLFAPYTAEEIWEMLGHEPSVAHAVWPEADQTLLVEDSVVAIVQINGKVRAKLEVSPGISAEQLEAQAMAEPQIASYLEGHEVAKVVVRTPKVVSIQLT